MNRTKCCNITNVNRRAFLAQGTLFITGVTSLSRCAFSQPASEPILRIALLTDVHYADKTSSGNRYYQESLEKLDAAAVELGKNPIDFAVELGDFIDSTGDWKTDQTTLRTVNAAFAKICEQRHYVLGNHCVETLTKQEFLDEIEQDKSWYSFDVKDWHFIVLDACFRRDGVPYGRKNADWTDTMIPEEELEWLQIDLAATSRPCILFLHQRLDLDNQHAYAVKNADKVRAVLEASGKARLVLQGHDHKGDCKAVGGITYCTLSAVIEGSEQANNAFSLLEIMKNGNIHFHGFFRQESHSFPKEAG